MHLCSNNNNVDIAYINVDVFLNAYRHHTTKTTMQAAASTSTTTDTAAPATRLELLDDWGISRSGSLDASESSAQCSK